MVVVHSTTKGLSAMEMALAHSRGWLDYDERVCAYWPEFAQQGKEAITVRQLLAHQAGLFAFDEPVDRSVVADPDRLAAVMARQRPAWEPGARQAYHGLTLGFYEGELMRRVDPRHRTLGRFFQDEIADPLGLEVYIRVPESLPDARLATLRHPDAAAVFGSNRLSDAAAAGRCSATTRTSTARSESTPAPRWCATRSASTRASSRCRPAAASAPRAPSHAPTASSRPAAAS